MKKPIGISGYKFVGKDTVAQTIINCSPTEYEMYGIASPIRDIGAIFGFTDGEMNNPLMKEKMNDIWGISWRKFAQFVGTDLLREQFRQDVWIKLAKMHIETSEKTIIVPDIRLDAEAQMIKEYGGFMIFVIRDGYSGDGHKTEMGVDLKYADCIISNNGSVEELQEKVKELHKNILIFNS